MRVSNQPSAKDIPSLAGLLCLSGFFLHIILSEPLLNSLGFHYSGDTGRFYEKIHPGSVLIILSFIILLWRNKSPLAQSLLFYRQQTSFTVLLAVYIILLLYMVARSGSQGMAFIIDTHMVVPMAAIVLSYTPASYCKKALYFFIATAAVNSLIGIMEASFKFRIFTFDPHWPVLREPYFRSSALLGHPLNNAMFTSVALFIALALRLRWQITAMLFFIFIISLVAFGGRAALAFSAMGAMVLCVIALKNHFTGQRITLLQLWLYLIAALVVPALLLAGFYLVIGSTIGERIATHMWWDNSADSRLMAMGVFHYLSYTDMLLGIPPARIMDINAQMNLNVTISDIENPWLLMYLNLGLVGFTLWLPATIAFIFHLQQRQPLALRFAVIAYFVIASTSNSFGRKDSIYVIMTAAVICASRTIALKKAPPLC